MIQKIPTDIELFNKFINETDNRQHIFHEYLIPKLTPDAKWDYTDAEKHVDEKTRVECWGWTKDVSEQWSRFRSINDELYNKLANAEGEERNQLTKQLNENISKCIEYDKKHKVIIGILFGGHSNNDDKKVFNVKQDVMQFETPLRTISFTYEKQLPFSDFEKKLIDKYVEMYNQLPKTTKYVINELNAMAELLPGYWERLFICKEKADKASNTICFPPAAMKGGYSPAISVYIPTAEEQQLYINEFNTSINDLIHELNAHFDHVNEIQKLIHGEDEDEKKSKTLFSQVDAMYHKLLHQNKNSIDVCIFANDFDEFKGVWSDERKKMEKVWDVFIKKDNVLGDVWQELYDLLKAKFAPKPRAANMPPPLNMPPSNPEFDELKKETMQRFETEVSTFFDAEDWHIILDNYGAKNDLKNKAKYLEIALTQHPESSTLLLRKADEEVSKQEFKKALDLVNKAETLETYHHPNFYLIKANILCQLHTPELAIPLYDKLINTKSPGVERYQQIASYNLLDIYENMGNYLECISITKNLFEKNKNDEILFQRLCGYYRSAELFKEAEETIAAFIADNPDNASSIEQLGLSSIENKDYRKAIEYFDKAFNINKDENYGSLFHMGNAYIELKEFDDAATCFETSILYYHFDKKSHLAAVQCYKELDMPYMVDYHINKILELDPEFTESLNIMKEQGN